MGQYWVPANLDKREYIDPHKLGCGLKLWEQFANHPGTGAALLALLCDPEGNGRGGGDLSPNPVLGRWCGDRIVIAGDYCDDTCLDVNNDDGNTVRISLADVYSLCHGPDEEAEDEGLRFTDVTDLVKPVIEAELDGVFIGKGWQSFAQAGTPLIGKLADGKRVRGSMRGGGNGTVTITTREGEQIIAPASAVELDHEVLREQNQKTAA